MSLLTKRNVFYSSIACCFANICSFYLHVAMNLWLMCQFFSEKIK